MIVGILSDTHDNIEKLEEAMRFFEEYGVGLVLHAGDHDRPDLYDEIGFRMIAVLGNHDDKYRFENYTNARGRKIEFHEGTRPLTIDGKRMCLYHGKYGAITAELLNCQEYDLVITGHDHMPHLKIRGKTYWLDPGHFKVPVDGKHQGYPYATVALYDTEKNDCEIFELD